jgi:hypothetical protein
MLHNSLSSLEEINTSQDTVVRFHMLDSIWALEPISITINSISHKISLLSKMDKINSLRKMIHCYLMFLTKMSLKMDLNKNNPLLIRKVQMKMLWKNMVMDFG